MSRPTKQKPPSPEGTDALANFARVFWAAAVREVEERIDEEEEEEATGRQGCASKERGKD